ncbi:hypothetical protein LQ327_28970 [Actinomycetospora endophytica]|uniref:Uncharacterized protein n=1 Tax=Actinomycetospora endophytica TaxID=2291215 RepID=A0ABS8PGM5_9PSEU|nr:hypothetical protein [Actinomycetospora endophytica]MCD2197410.1 hypothetical protein [Actinomycetospora endophytica]
MSRRETERSGAGLPGEGATPPAGSGGGRWWGRAVVACASLAALAGTVAAVATAAGADGDQAERSEAAARDAADASRPPTPHPAADTATAAVTTRPAAGPERVGAPTLGATVEIPAGWEATPDQDLVPVPPDRFPTIVALPNRAAVLVGRMDAARGFGPDALADEARRLVGAFADGTTRQAPGGNGRIADVSDDAGRLDGRDSHTVVRRVTGAKGPGALVRVTTVAGQGGEPGLVLLAVAGPGPRQAADAAAADRIVRSLSSAPPDAPPRNGRAQAPPASAAPGLPPRGAPTSAPPRAPASSPPRPSSRAPVSPPPGRPAPPSPTDR